MGKENPDGDGWFDGHTARDHVAGIGDIMVLLSAQQCRDYAVPLIRLTMGDELGNRASYEFVDAVGEDSDLWGLWDGDILTCIAGIGSQISNKKVWMGYLAVHPKYRRKGLASVGMNWVESIMVKRGYRWCLVETYEAPHFEGAINLYKKRGYVKVGELAGYLDDDSDILYLRKPLKE